MLFQQSAFDIKYLFHFSKTEEKLKKKNSFVGHPLEYFGAKKLFVLGDMEFYPPPHTWRKNVPSSVKIDLRFVWSWSWENGTLEICTEYSSKTVPFQSKRWIQPSCRQTNSSSLRETTLKIFTHYAFTLFLLHIFLSVNAYKILTYTLRMLNSQNATGDETGSASRMVHRKDRGPTELLWK